MIIDERSGKAKGWGRYVYEFKKLKKLSLSFKIIEENDAFISLKFKHIVLPLVCLAQFGRL